MQTMERPATAADVLSGDATWAIEDGDCRSLMAAMPESSVHACITSSPYYGLRDYSNAPGVWGGNAECDHEFADASWRANRWGASDDDKPGKKQRTNPGSLGHRGGIKRQSVCVRCGAWKGCLGLEPTIEMFVENIVEVFRGVRRVLRDQGVCWLNLGDSYANDGKWGGETGGKHVTSLHGSPVGRSRRSTGLKPKDLCMIPARVALALQADGWYLRSEVTWAKLAPMPESVKDRPTSATEKVFLLTKSPSYHYDQDAERVPIAESQVGRIRCDRIGGTSWKERNQHSDGGEFTEAANGRNLWNYWLLSPEFFGGAHFATMPTELARRCIRLGTSERGCCPKCGAPWKRLIEKERRATRPGTDSKVTKLRQSHAHRDDIDPDINWRNSTLNGEVGNRDPQRHTTDTRTIGWEAGCDCGLLETTGCLVLDPFGGAGTTVMVARRLGCRAIAFELNPEYAEMARQRVRDDAPLFN